MNPRSASRDAMHSSTAPWPTVAACPDARFWGRRLRSYIPLKRSQGWGPTSATPGHHGETQGWGAPDLSDDQVWAPAPTYPWAPFVLNICAFAINRQSVRGTSWLRSDVSLIPCFLSHNSWMRKKFYVKMFSVRPQFCDGGQLFSWKLFSWK